MSAQEKTKTTKYDLSIHTNPDADTWARYFLECNPNTGLDVDDMRGWFANAMMAMHDYLKGGGPINGDHAQYLIDMEKTCNDEIRR